MQEGLAAVADEFVVDGFVGLEDGGASTVGYSPDVDGVAVVVIEEEDVVVAGAGGYDESAGEVRECFARAGVPDGRVAQFRGNAIGDGFWLEILLGVFW